MDQEQIFMQKVIRETDQLLIRSASTGERVCLLQAVDGSHICCAFLQEGGINSRMGSRA